MGCDDGTPQYMAEKQASDFAHFFFFFWRADLLDDHKPVSFPLACSDVLTT